MTARTDYAAETDLVIANAEQDMDGWWRSTESMAPAARQSGFRKLMVRLTYMYGAVAADAARAYLYREWFGYGGDFLRLPYPDLAPAISSEQVAASTDWAMQTQAGGLAVAIASEVRDRAVGVLVRAVMQQARDTIAENAAKAGTRFARVPEPGACAFCTMLASRGGVYLDSGNALSSDGAKWHSNCRCTAIQVRDDRELPAASHRAMQSYKEWTDEIDRSRGANVSDFQAWMYEKSKK
ncbi:hypothetical protein [Corynebacterium glyciniphilum]|uniref:VG15 protein n=1 Tax=Corynebacterium glyciniphilum TaxID=1404244 RepID=UPI00264B189E|nr:hypothetical protein [Corynebacterium glyciniphilum]MDN6706384.1 hypothetical protein [Corynebacterium glyciniphilum]